QEADAAGTPKRFPFLTSRQFAERRWALEWHVRKLMAKNQHGVLGGPKKTLKTSVLVDAALSLGTGTTFLNFFVVDRPVRVGIISGESGPAVLQETARRVAAEKGIDLAEADVFWGFELPQLADLGDLAALQEAVEENALEVLFLDPLYLAMLAGV